MDFPPGSQGTNFEGLTAWAFKTGTPMEQYDFTSVLPSMWTTSPHLATLHGLSLAFPIKRDSGAEGLSDC